MSARSVLCVHDGEGAHVDRPGLYLPKSWTADRDRCREAGAPDEVDFATKQVLAQQMLARALDAGVLARWVSADEAYGGDSKFRRWLKGRRIGYVVAVPTSAPIMSVSGSWRDDQAVADAPPQAWKRLSCGEGAKGPRLFDWAVATLPTISDAGPGWRRWLSARRSLTRNTKGELEIAYYPCGAPIGTSDEELIRVAGARWAVEDCFQTAKTEVGLDQYQVRRYDGWYRHITLAMLAHTYLAVTAAVSPKVLVAASFHSTR
ncbi:IS701 family transposase [Nocardia fluminea]